VQKISEDFILGFFSALVLGMFLYGVYILKILDGYNTIIIAIHFVKGLIDNTQATLGHRGLKKMSNLLATTTIPRNNHLIKDMSMGYGSRK